jgi:hypothetical protein
MQFTTKNGAKIDLDLSYDNILIYKAIFNKSGSAEFNMIIFLVCTVVVHVFIIFHSPHFILHNVQPHLYIKWHREYNKIFKRIPTWNRLACFTCYSYNFL